MIRQIFFQGVEKMDSNIGLFIRHPSTQKSVTWRGFIQLWRIFVNFQSKDLCIIFSKDHLSTRQNLAVFSNSWHQDLLSPKSSLHKKFEEPENCVSLSFACTLYNFLRRIATLKSVWLCSLRENLHFWYWSANFQPHQNNRVWNKSMKTKINYIFSKFSD
jgi:hypothetical protein